MGCMWIGRIAVWCVALGCVAQQPKLPYDPNDPEGTVMHPNGRGRVAWKRKGHWKVSKLYAPSAPYGRVPAATAAEIQTMTAVLNALSPVLQATPEGGNPVGYWMNESRTFGYPDPGGPPVLTYSSGFFPFYIEDTLVNGKFVQATGGETQSAYFYFNRLPGRLEQPVRVAEKRQDGVDVEFFPRPKVTATFRGLQVYDGQDLVIARAGRDPWAAAPYGRVLRAAMRLFEEDRKSAETRLAGYRRQNDEAQAPAYEQKMREYLEKSSGALRTTNPGKWETRFASMERELKYNRELAAKRANPQRDKDGNWYWNAMDAQAEAARRLAAMTPQEAARPACFAASKERDGRYLIQGMIVPAGTGEACEELVMDNLEYFDRALGRAAPQLMVLRSVGRCAALVDGKLVAKDRVSDRVPPQGCLRHVPIWEAMDWGRVASLLVR